MKRALDGYLSRRHPGRDRSAAPARHGYRRRHRRAILFDLDGTLLDSAALIVTAFQETCRTHLDREVDRATVLNGWSQTIRQRFSAIAPDRADALVQDYLARYLTLHDSLIRMFPGIPEVLEALHRRGYALGIVTSKRRVTTQAAVRAFHLDRWCTTVVVDEDVSRPKPDPEPVRTAALRLGVEPRDALMVGDTPVDVTAGRRAGAGTAAALWDPVSLGDVLAECPDHRLERPEDLLPLCPPR